MEIRVVIDTNVMIGFLVGKRLKKIKDRLSEASIRLILTDQLINELKSVTSRPKFKKYFNKQDVVELIELFSIIGQTYPIQDIPEICRDPKDNFLLSLCLIGNVDYLVTGDKDLLELIEYKDTKIVTASEFEKIL